MIMMGTLKGFPYPPASFAAGIAGRLRTRFVMGNLKGFPYPPASFAAGIAGRLRTRVYSVRLNWNGVGAPCASSQSATTEVTCAPNGPLFR